MLTLKAIREELKEIRYYMSRKAVFDKVRRLCGQTLYRAKAGII